MSDAARAFSEPSDPGLQPGTRLREFEIRRQLGSGGFGIVYLARDHALEREVAIKEYMPSSMAGRTQALHVSLRSRADAEVFALGLRSFVNEAKLLARFDHPSLVKVYRFWEAHGTAYMVMPVMRGRTLKEIRRSAEGAVIDEAWARRILAPLLDALEQLHVEGVYHRDIAPDNIHLEADDRPVLLDFGAARHVISGKTQTLTAILKPAYAPIEQYAEAGGVKQGPWTDLYALGATLHYMLLGRPPAPATARTVGNEASELARARLPGCSAQFLGIVDWMLAPRPSERPQSVAALRAVLAGAAALPSRAHVAPPTPRPESASARMVTVPLGEAAEADIALEFSAFDAGPSHPSHPSHPPAGGAAAWRRRHEAAGRSALAAVPAVPADVLRADAHHRLPPPPVRRRGLPLMLAGLALAAALAYAAWPGPG